MDDAAIASLSGWLWYPSGATAHAVGAQLGSPNYAPRDMSGRAAEAIE